MNRGDRIVEFVGEYITQHGFSPSIREIGDAVGISSTSNVKYWIDKEVEDGRLTRKPKVARSVRVA